MIQKKTEKEEIIASLEWCAFHLGEPEKNTFGNALKLYISQAITYIKKAQEVDHDKNKLDSNSHCS